MKNKILIIESCCRCCYNGDDGNGKDECCNPNLLVVKTIEYNFSKRFPDWCPLMDIEPGRIVKMVAETSKE
jgi:hypothetical protein